jgi:uncharacterized protein involved in type VI secretion and phage assembly
VSSGRGGSDGNGDLFKGEITGLEADYDLQGQRVVVRAYDYSHRMHRGRHTEAYKNKSDSDIARKLAQRCSIDIGTIDNSGATHDHVSQVNLTDWEFIKARAREIGYETGVAEGKFFFRRPQVNQGAPGAGDLDATGALQLTFGSDLLEFHPRVSAVAQVSEVKARGWNYLDKIAVIGQSTPDAENNAPEIPSRPVALGRALPGTKPYLVTDRVLATQAEATEAAKGMARQISSAMGEADGVARGNPRVKAGAALSIAAVAPQFAGTWTVTASRHTFDAQGYKTMFSVAGRQERSLLGLASMGATSGVPSAGGPPIYGVVVALVTNIKDPEGLHRVKLKFPWLSDDYETWWCRMALPAAGNGRGYMWLPEVDDEVLVSFEQGDVRRPYVVGTLYNGRDKIADGNGTHAYDSSGRSVLKGFRSREGHSLVMFDDDSKNGVLLSTGDTKFKLKLDQTGTDITIDSDGTIHIKAMQDISIESNGNIKIKATQNLELEGGTKATLKAPMVEVNGSGTVDIDGGMITLN